MTVYGDILFAENFIIGCALIYITAEVSARISTGVLQSSDSLPAG